MAGGKGTRLASVIQDIPKPMVKLADKPLLEYQIENLKENEITEIILVIGHLGNVIKEHFGNGKKFGVHITYFEEKEPLGTAGALFYLKDVLKENFVLLFGDLFVNINFQRFIKYHQMKNAKITLYTHPNSHPYDSDIIVTNEDGQVIDWSYKNTKRTQDYKNQVNAGIYVVSPEVLKNIKKNQKTDLEKDVIINMIPCESVYAYSCTEYVKDIGTPKRLEKVEKDYQNGVCEKRNLKNRQKCIFLDRDGTINRHVGFLTSPDQLELEDSAAEAIQKINESEYLAIVISNQPVVARGECSFDMLEKIHNKMYTLLGKDGAYLDGLFFCPHHPDSGFEGEVTQLKIDCNCRKPKTGLIMQAAETFNIDAGNSWMIGDTTMDIQTGINAGMRTILVKTGEGGMDGKYNVIPDYVARNLSEAVDIITNED